MRGEGREVRREGGMEGGEAGGIQRVSLSNCTLLVVSLHRKTL